MAMAMVSSPSSSSKPNNFPDIFSWLYNLPPFHQWQTMSVNLSRPSDHLTLSINNSNNSFFSLSISISSNYSHLPVALWTSKKLFPNPNSLKLLDASDTNNLLPTLLSNFIEDVLKYGPNNTHSLKVAADLSGAAAAAADILNFSFLNLALAVCVYEAPDDIRGGCLAALVEQYGGPKSRRASRTMMRVLGSNVEEQWMRSMNLAITNWMAEVAAEEVRMPMFSYSVSTAGLWKVQVYCPVMAMEVEKASCGAAAAATADERLLFSLRYHQVEGVIQLNYVVDVQDKWIEVLVNTDNIRCDVFKLLTDRQLRERGAGASEKHFPSRISLQISPSVQTSVLSVSVSKSTQNPRRDLGVEKGIEASFEPPTAIGLHISAGESVTTTLKPWKFEQSVHANTANLHWFLHDSGDGREVFSSKPSKLALLHPKAWFKNRYSSAARPFTRQGGVIFAGDEYGERVTWRVDRRAVGRAMEWEIKGCIWLTYWPNKHRTFYTETRKLEFREILLLNLP
ncbi:uncharacterized protein LOC127259951 [Andrographis paniculata]|uniref:uncharacterized protein LOC127259951 n=1 Tax=Andrographis paniculata TaxID=175694 RepID=UPI0021E78489|nr:uncharacterized protein LOC127259951 [Andrographis paniculata]